MTETPTETPGAARRRRMAAIPHRQASPIRVVDVAGGRGVAPYRQHPVTTACGQEMQTTLVTWTDDRVRCPGCRAAMAAEIPADRMAGPACQDPATCPHESCWSVTWPQFAQPAPAGRWLVVLSNT